ncbi:hypothetical protein Baya_12507 [Bagarius yarrelli]|uniref:Uncharacterized protein n=1 Tax=Bagarius yarrelli TaxID=175774 RepID=A0A556V8J6_BAGYA|nr:hypothetical protein Baya_12507 [Bagarius yarrelli]
MVLELLKVQELLEVQKLLKVWEVQELLEVGAECFQNQTEKTSGKKSDQTAHHQSKTLKYTETQMSMNSEKMEGERKTQLDKHD